MGMETVLEAENVNYTVDDEETLKRLYGIVTAQRLSRMLPRIVGNM